MKMTKTMWWVVGGAGIAGLGVGIYFFVKKRKNKKEVSFSALGRIGNKGNTGKPVIVTGGGKATPVEEPNWNAPFNMNYLGDVKNWLQGKRIKELPTSAARKYALELMNAKGLFDDDEKAVKRVFRSLQDKTQVASLSKAFYFNHKQDMYQYLKGFLSDGEMKKLVKDPVRRLPNYRLA
ncbi:LPXTG cell wall anchor domain-containing protein [uncultured Aquimarina sp.]|uniref:LPXTG cell wall anchor domain-containing protein n=1 Tax=uncultured Aquimarina sp. TaxID=575652 RepID=UPI0026351737|nr:LPXTG cell wall anchor domain-containing protein [uncultured Aquimarina sp.]